YRVPEGAILLESPDRRQLAAGHQRVRAGDQRGSRLRARSRWNLRLLSSARVLGGLGSGDGDSESQAGGGECPRGGQLASGGTRGACGFGSCLRVELGVGGTRVSARIRGTAELPNRSSGVRRDVPRTAEAVG